MPHESKTGARPGARHGRYLNKSSSEPLETLFQFIVRNSSGRVGAMLNPGHLSSKSVSLAGLMPVHVSQPMAQP